MQEEAPEITKKKDDDEEGDVDVEDEEERDREQNFDALFEKGNVIQLNSHTKLLLFN